MVPAWPVLRTGLRGEPVRALQYLLSERASLAVDGVFGPITRKAVMAFQFASALVADGVVGSRTWARLAPQIQRPSEGQPVRAGQMLLQTHEFPIAIDGQFGRLTEAAVAAWQKQCGEAITGAIDDKTWSALLTPRSSRVLEGPDLALGQRGAIVTALQYLLREKGFWPQPPNGLLDQETQERVDALKHTSPTQGVDSVPWALLVRSVGPGATGDAVRAVQALLNQSGHDLVTDGQFGPRTADAVSVFKGVQGIASHILVDAASWLKLLNAALPTSPNIGLPLNEDQQKLLLEDIWQRYEGRWSADWTGVEAANYDVRVGFSGPVVLRQRGRRQYWDVAIDLTARATGNHWYAEAEGLTEISLPDFGYVRRSGVSDITMLFTPRSFFTLLPKSRPEPVNQVPLNYRVTRVIEQPPSPDVGETPTWGYTAPPIGTSGLDFMSAWPSQWPLRVETKGRSLYSTHNATHELRLDHRSTGHILWYDGVFLSLIDADSGSVSRRWPAFSGNAGVDASAESQKKPDIGSIPAGLYQIDPRKTISRARAEDTWDWIAWTVLSPSWGLVHTPLTPWGGTDTYGRSKFNVHGGSRPGSAGCIDLVEGNADFFAWFGNERDHLGDAFSQYLVVAYVPVRQTNPRTHSTPWACPENPAFYCTQNTACTHNRHFAGQGLAAYQAEHQTLLDRILRVLTPG